MRKGECLWSACFLLLVWSSARPVERWQPCLTAPFYMSIIFILFYLHIYFQGHSRSYIIDSQYKQSHIDGPGMTKNSCQCSYLRIRGSSASALWQNGSCFPHKQASGHWRKALRNGSAIFQVQEFHDWEFFITKICIVFYF